MKTTISAKFKLHPTPEQLTVLRTTQLAYRDALNAVSQYAFAHNNMSNAKKLHKGMYHEIRTRFGLPSQLACTVSRQVGATYKGLWTKVNLTDIRERTTRRTRKRKKNGKGFERVSVKQRKANAVSSKWSFAALQSMLAYKASLSGSLAIKVDAHYTSQACPRCGHTAPANRPHHGLLFVCQNCHYTLHADLVGARNITMRTLLIRQDWLSTGVLSERPDVSSDEIKAARLRRYAELRWSSDTSLSDSAGGL